MTRKERFKELGTEIGELVGEKDEHYGEMMESTRLFLLSIFPDGISVDQYREVGLLVRTFDKQRRSVHGGHDKAEDWRDIAGYGLQGLNYYSAADVPDTNVGEIKSEPQEEISDEEMQKIWGNFCKERSCREGCPLSVYSFGTESCRNWALSRKQEALEIMRKAVE